MSPSLAHWPPYATPQGATIYAYNETTSSATPEALWSWLVRAADWSTWYANCKRLRFQDSPGPDLYPGCRFRWTTFGVPVSTVVDEFEPPLRLAWSGTAFGSTGYHAWTLLPQGSQTRIVTEETQRGVIPRLGRWILQREIVRQHQLWVEALARRAEQGSAQPPRVHASPCPTASVRPAVRGRASSVIPARSERRGTAVCPR